MRWIALIVALAFATPALAQNASQTIAQQIGALVIQNAQNAETIAQRNAQIADLNAKIADLQKQLDAAKKTEKPEPKK